MFNKLKDFNSTENYIQLIISKIKLMDYDLAIKLSKELIYMDVENAIPYNFLGIIYELSGDLLKAIKFYRVAYYIDQTYAPSRNNLSRATNFRYSLEGIEYEGNQK